VPGLGHKNICWLDIAMNDAFGVSGVERISDMASESTASISIGGLCLTLKPSQGLRVFGHFVEQKLQGDETMQSHIFSLIDHTHPADALEDSATPVRLVE
jgi:hypothetical protein